MKALILGGLAAVCLAAPALAQQPAAAPAGSAVTGFSFVGLNVTDMTKSMAFYKLLGMTEQFRNETPAYLEVGMGVPGKGPTQLLVQRKQGQAGIGVAGGFTRTSYFVNDVRGLLAKMKAAGYTVRGPNGSPAAKVSVGFVTDPDGYPIELVQLLN